MLNTQATIFATTYTLNEAALSTAAGVLERGRDNGPRVTSARAAIANDYLAKDDAIALGIATFEHNFHAGTFTVFSTSRELLESLPTRLHQFDRGELTVWREATA